MLIRSMAYPHPAGMTAEITEAGAIQVSDNDGRMCWTMTANEAEVLAGVLKDAIKRARHSSEKEAA